LLDYDTIRIYELAQKSILDIDFPKGIQISYARKDILDQVTKADILVPQGILYIYI
jgi:hypothetical protein